MYKTLELTLDTERTNNTKTNAQNFLVNTNDYESVKIIADIVQDKEQVDLTDATVKLAIRKPDHTIVFQDGTVTAAIEGECEFVLETQSYILKGTHVAEVMIYFLDGKVVVTRAFAYHVAEGILSDTAIESTSWYQDVNELQLAVQELQVEVDAFIATAVEETRAEITEVDTRLTSQLAETAQVTGLGVNKFPRLAGETDDLPRFQRAIDSLVAEGGGRLVVPKLETPYLFQFSTGGTITNPTRVEITSDNIEIVGLGNPTIEMKGLTTAYLFSIDDYASSGRDIFTAFSFMGVQNCGITGIRFVGEYTGDEVFRYQSPRSIAVAFKGSSNCYADTLEGENILGNLVNVVNSNITYDAPFALCENITVENVRAIHCLENGINYMGGTKNSVASNIVSTGCANGLESACEGFTLNGAVLIGNRSSGLGLSGKNQIVNGVVATDNVRNVGGVPDPSVGFGLVITGGENIQINGGKFNDNYSHGIYIYPGVKKVQINNPEIRRNAKDATNKIAIQMVGTALKRIQDINIFGGEIEAEGAVTGSIVNFADNVRIMSMKGTFDTASSALSFAADCNGSQAIGNRFNKVVTMNDPTGEEYNNGLYRKIDRTSIPTTGTWILGDIINNRSRSQGSIAEWNVIQSGTFGTLNSGATTGSIEAGATALAVSSATGLYKGAYILIAGVTGVKRVVSISGTTVTLDSAADVTVSAAAVSYRAPVVIPVRQNGPKTAITASPDYVGQIAVTGGTTPVAYIAVGTASTADWKQINN